MAKNADLHTVAMTQDRAGKLKRLLDSTENEEDKRRVGGKFVINVTPYIAVSSVATEGDYIYFTGLNDAYSKAYKDYLNGGMVLKEAEGDELVNGCVQLVKEIGYYDSSDNKLYQCRIIDDGYWLYENIEEENITDDKVYVNNKLEFVETEAEATYVVISKKIKLDHNYALCLMRRIGGGGSGGHEYTLTKTNATMIRTVSSTTASAVTGVTETTTTGVSDVTINDQNSFNYISNVEAQNGVLVFTLGTYIPVTASTTTETMLSGVSPQTSSFVSGVTTTSLSVVRNVVLNEVNQ